MNGNRKAFHGPTPTTEPACRATGSTQMSRRRLIKGTLAIGGALAAPSLIRSSLAAERLVIGVPGGLYEKGWSLAFTEPFKQATGVEAVLVARPFYPSAQVQAQVEAKSYQWDVVSLSKADVDLLGRSGSLEALDLSGPDIDQIMPAAKRPDWLGIDVYGTVLAYRSDTFKTAAPQNWADLWDPTRFPGRRAMYKNPLYTLETALLADGVSPKQLYPLDVPRAFKKLDQIRSKVNVWWDNGSQSTQLIHDHAVDLMAIWNGRAQAAIDDGAPVKIVWNQGISTVHGFAIPKGSPKKALGQQFIKFCADAKRQSLFPRYTASGPTNLQAYKYIDQALAQNLPTAPQNVAVLIEQDVAFWRDHKEELITKFNEWLLS